MDATEKVERYLQAVLDQLKAEIAASPYTVKSLAAELGINYTQFLTYVNGTRDMPQRVLVAAVDVLGIAQETFVKLARERAERA